MHKTAAAPRTRITGRMALRIIIRRQLRRNIGYLQRAAAKPGIHLQRTLRAWLDGQKFSGVRIKIDVNPYYFM